MSVHEEVQILPQGDGPRTKVENSMEGARAYLRKVGAIQNSERGVWSITSTGQAVTEADVKKIVAQVRAMDRKPSNGSEQSTAEQPEEDPPALRWQDERLAILQNMT